MAIAVRPTFFEKGHFNSSAVKQQRLIHGKNIYSINRVHTDGERYADIFFTSNGKLKRQRSTGQLIDAPIMPGTYYFFVSKHDLHNHAEVLNHDNCVEITVSDQANQEITLPWPMCYHSFDGTTAVAEYILGEIRNNSVSNITKAIYYYNDYEGRFAEYRRLPIWSQALQRPPQPMKIEAYATWGLQVGNRRPWDHKPLISGDRHLQENAVLRPLRRGGEFVRGYHHKYKDYDYFYDVWSNIHYGYVGRAAGFTANELLDGAGLEQLATNPIRRQVHDETASGMRRFDDIPDQRTIELGIELFTNTEGDATRLTREDILDGLERLGNEGFLEGNRVKHICFDDDGFTVA